MHDRDQNHEPDNDYGQQVAIGGGIFFFAMCLGALVALQPFAWIKAVGFPLVLGLAVWGWGRSVFALFARAGEPFRRWWGE